MLSYFLSYSGVENIVYGMVVYLHSYILISFTKIVYPVFPISEYNLGYI